MCGRYTVPVLPQEVARYFGVRLRNFRRHDNIAPKQTALVIREEGRRRLDVLRSSPAPGQALASVGLLLALAGCAGQFSEPPPPSNNRLCTLWGYGPEKPGCPFHSTGGQ